MQPLPLSSQQTLLFCEPMFLYSCVVGYTFGILCVLLASTKVLTPIGAAGSADYVSEEPHGGYYVEYDDPADE